MPSSAATLFGNPGAGFFVHDIPVETGFRHGNNIRDEKDFCDGINIRVSQFTLVDFIYPGLRNRRRVEATRHEDKRHAGLASTQAALRIHQVKGPSGP